MRAKGRLMTMQAMTGKTEGRHSTLDEVLAMETGAQATVHGLVHTLRDLGDVRFALLRMPQGILQCVLGAEEDVRDGDAVTVSGEAVRDERAPGGVELHAQRVKVLSRAAEAMPVPIGKNKMNLSLDTDLSLRFVTLRNLRKRAVFKIQEGIVRGFREALQKESIGGGWVTFSGKQCTEYGIATTAARMAHIVLHDEKAIMPASAELCGEYGETGLFAGVPCVLGANGVEQVIELPLSEEERAQFHSCCEGIRRNMQHLKEL